MRKELSDKMYLTSFICACIVVLRHSVNIQAFWGLPYMDNFACKVETFVHTLTGMAVPYFFCVSGYFFLRKSYYNASSYIGMLRVKAKTLLLPYCMWILIGYPLMWCVGLLDAPSSWQDCMLAVWESRGAGALWFVRNLMIVMALYPVWGWIFELHKKWLYVVCVALLFVYWVPVDTSNVSSECLFFFFVGGLLQRTGAPLDTKVGGLVWSIIVCLWVVSCCFAHQIWLARIGTALGVVVVWVAVDCLNRKDWLLRLSSLSFFVYVTHPYIIKGLKFLVAHYYYENQIAALVSFVLLALVAIVISCVMALLLKRHLPQLYSLLNGGR